MTRFLSPQGTSQCARGLTNVEDRKWHRAPPAFEAAVLSMLALTWDTMLALLAP